MLLSSSLSIPFLDALSNIVSHDLFTELISLQPFTNDFPRADIHELLSPDLLHQVIKGTFKDHLVTWIENYLLLAHGEARSNEILDDIDRRYDTASLAAMLH